MKNKILAILLAILPFLVFSQGPKGYGLIDFSLAKRQIKSNVNGQSQPFTLWGATLEGGISNIEGLPSGMTFGLGLDTDQEVVKMITGYDNYTGEPSTRSDFQQRRSDYYMALGYTAGPFRIMVTPGVQVRGHTRFFVTYDDGTTDELTNEHQFDGISPEFINWRIDLQNSFMLGGNITYISPKIFFRANGSYNFTEKVDPFLGRADLTFRPNEWFGMGGSAEYTYLNCMEYGGHFSLGFGNETVENSSLLFKFGVSFTPVDFNPQAKEYVAGFAGSLVFSFDHRHGREKKAAKDKSGFKDM